jgi:hypothetical protein
MVANSFSILHFFAKLVVSMLVWQSPFFNASELQDRFTESIPTTSGLPVTGFLIVYECTKSGCRETTRTLSIILKIAAMKRNSVISSHASAQRGFF